MFYYWLIFLENYKRIVILYYMVDFLIYFFYINILDLIRLVRRWECYMIYDIFVYLYSCVYVNGFWEIIIIFLFYFLILIYFFYFWYYVLYFYYVCEIWFKND